MSTDSYKTFGEKLDDYLQKIDQWVINEFNALFPRKIPKKAGDIKSEEHEEEKKPESWIKEHRPTVSFILLVVLEVISFIYSPGIFGFQYPSFSRIVGGVIVLFVWAFLNSATRRYGEIPLDDMTTEEKEREIKDRKANKDLGKSRKEAAPKSKKDKEKEEMKKKAAEAREEQEYEENVLAAELSKREREIVGLQLRARDEFNKLSPEEKVANQDNKDTLEKELQTRLQEIRSTLDQISRRKGRQRGRQQKEGGDHE